jgi:hypothetical protein
MKKIINVSLFGLGSNKLGSAHNNYIANFVFRDEKFKVDEIRKYIKENWKDFLKKGINVTNEFRYKMSIVVITDERCMLHKFEIDPKELR